MRYYRPDMTTLTIAKRFCGPPTTANGGYFAGLLAARASTTVSVRLRAPPPLDTELSVVQTADGRLEARHHDTVIGDATPATLDVRSPTPPPQYREAMEASRDYAGHSSPVPMCFVCGVSRTPGDGLRIFAGKVPGRNIVAAPWTPDASLDRGDGKIRPEFMSAALDCPGYYAIASNRMMLLAQYTVQVERLARVDEPCTVVGWHIGSNGRKHEAGTALFGADGDLCGRAWAMWIELRGNGP